MKKIVAAVLILMMALVFGYAENSDIAKYRVNDRLLSELSIDEIYEFEDSLVSALTVQFSQDAEKTDAGELLGWYVINEKTKRFHYPWCYSALEISADQRSFKRSTPSELSKDKYKPCGMCKPHVNAY